MSKQKRPPVKKATNLPVTAAFLQERFERSAKLGFAKQKWIIFCERLLDGGFSL